MKLNSVLVRRALILTAIVALVAIAVQLPVYSVINDHMAQTRTRTEVVAHVKTLVENANDPAAYSGATAMLGEMGCIVWLCDATGVRVISSTNATLPRSTVSSIEALGEGEFIVQKMHVGAQKYILAAMPAFVSGDKVTAAFAVALPYSYASSAQAFNTALIVALICAVLAGVVGVYTLILPIAAPLQRIQQVAVKVAGGSLTESAPEDGPGEIGALGASLNNVTDRLSLSLADVILERNRLKSVLDGLSEGIIAIDARGEITHVNPSMSDLFLGGRSSLLYLPDARMRLIPDATVWEDFDAVIAGGENITRNLNVRNITLRMVISPVKDELDHTAGAVGLFRDVTQEERLERTRREYVSNVSHELRTPLTAVRALVEPLRDGMVTKEEDRRRYYDIILREVMRLTRLINDQLELSRLQSGSCAIEKSRFTLSDMVLDVCDRYAGIAADHDLTLSIDTDFEAIPAVYSNPDRAEQLLIILLDNAIKYTEKGGVHVSAKYDAEKVCITVSDTGVGIAEADLPYVFDRFYKVDKAHSGKGSGLGLSIAKELLTLMGEEISVESTQGEGTAFAYTLHRPAATPEENTGVEANEKA